LPPNYRGSFLQSFCLDFEDLFPSLSLPPIYYRSLLKGSPADFFPPSMEDAGPLSSIHPPFAHSSPFDSDPCNPTFCGVFIAPPPFSPSSEEPFLVFFFNANGLKQLDPSPPSLVPGIFRPFPAPSDAKELPPQAKNGHLFLNFPIQLLRLSLPNKEDFIPWTFKLGLIFLNLLFLRTVSPEPT